MKVLGTIGTDLCVQVSHNELAAITGISVDWQSNKYRGPQDTFWYSLIGVEFKITDALRRVKRLNEGPIELDQAAAMLRRIADELSPLALTINSATADKAIEEGGAA